MSANRSPGEAAGRRMSGVVADEGNAGEKRKDAVRKGRRIRAEKIRLDKYFLSNITIQIDENYK